MFDNMVDTDINRYGVRYGAKCRYLGDSHDYELEHDATDTLVLWVGDLSSIGGEGVVGLDVVSREHAIRIVIAIEGK